jgi:hypothetical protein
VVDSVTAGVLTTTGGLFDDSEVGGGVGVDVAFDVVVVVSTATGTVRLGPPLAAVVVVADDFALPPEHPATSSATAAASAAYLVNITSV